MLVPCLFKADSAGSTIAPSILQATPRQSHVPFDLHHDETPNDSSRYVAWNPFILIRNLVCPSEVGCTCADHGNGLDTLDLQDHDAPSAKDHTKQPEHPNPLGGGRPAPHQELSIRHAEQDSKAEILSGSTLNGNHEYRDGVDMYGEPEETDEDIGRNGEYDHEEDGDLEDGESDHLLDDDMMDKLSSSPSIDDGSLMKDKFLK